MVFSTGYCETGGKTVNAPPFSVSQNNRYNPTLSSYEKTFGLSFGLLCSKNVKKNISERIQAGGGEGFGKPL